ncbi:hypothetical protein FACS1894200_00580 [Spirochaetia bacterium]|nr:hypothetical protein FACS1894200_00580 [Spirochaetia bacterium]
MHSCLGIKLTNDYNRIYVRVSEKQLPYGAAPFDYTPFGRLRAEQGEAGSGIAVDETDPP